MERICVRIFPSGSKKMGMDRLDLMGMDEERQPIISFLESLLHRGAL
jgi:hypothetical protein